MIDAIARALAHHLGPQVVVRAGPARDVPMLDAEAQAVRRAIPTRRAEFATGRALAREAMETLGLDSCAIPQGTDRAPTWPEGVVGSISHTHGSVAVAVGKSQHIMMLGIDVEQDRRLEPGVARRIVMPHETADPDLAIVIFSAKEAVYKAMYPLTGDVWGFDAVTITLDAQGCGFSAELHLGAADFPRGAILRGHYVRQDGLVGTALSCPQTT